MRMVTENLEPMVNWLLGDVVNVGKSNAYTYDIITNHLFNSATLPTSYYLYLMMSLKFLLNFNFSKNQNVLMKISYFQLSSSRHFQIAFSQSNAHNSSYFLATSLLNRTRVWFPDLHVGIYSIAPNRNFHLKPPLRPTSRNPDPGRPPGTSDHQGRPV